MKLRTWLGSVVVVVLLGAAKTFSQDSVDVLSLQKGEGISQAMSRTGYNLGWIAQVIAENRINLKSLRHLPEGMVFRVNREYKNQAPSAVAEMSEMLLKIEKQSSNASLNLAELERVSRELEIEKERSANAGKIVDQQKGTILTLTETLKKQKKEIDLARAKQNDAGRTQLLFGLATFLVLGVLLLWGLVPSLFPRVGKSERDRAKILPDPNVISLKKAIVVWPNATTTIEFKLSSYQPNPASRDPASSPVAFYRCGYAGCSERMVAEHRIELHAKRHVEAPKIQLSKKAEAVETETVPASGPEANIFKMPTSK